MLERVKRTVINDLLGLDVRALHRVDGINLHRPVMPHVGNYVILGLRARDRNWFGSLVEQVHDRTATQSKRLGPNLSLERGNGPIQKQQDFQAIAELARRAASSPAMSTNMNLLGKQKYSQSKR